jgi:ketol-acid reductoisomerase
VQKALFQNVLTYVALEMYGSGEAAEIFREMGRVGLFKQMQLYSQTSQCGTLSRAVNISFQQENQSSMDRAMAAIRDGTFVKEWRREQEAGYPHFKELRAQTEKHPLNAAEARMRELLKCRTE